MQGIKERNKFKSEFLSRISSNLKRPITTIYEVNKTTSELSDKISKDLQKRGMKFVGSTIIYSYLQAIGVIYSHDENCFLFKNQ